MNIRGERSAAEEYFVTAQMFHREGRLAEAEQQYRAAIELDDSYCDAMEWFGALCLQSGKIDEAIHWLDKAATLNPENAAFHDNLAAALMQAQRPKEAAGAYQRSLAAAPDAVETRINLANVLRRLGHHGKAMALLEQAVASDPHLKTVCRDPTTPSTGEARCNTILENCRHILARYPNYAPAHYSAACALLNLGRTAEACRIGERAISLDPTVPVYYHILIEAGEVDQKASAVSALEHLAGDETMLPEDGRSMLHFLLAKAYDNQKRYEEAFAHLQKANGIKRSMIVYDETREIGRMDAIATAFTLDRVRSMCGAGHPSLVPVFIVGMVRSGTTLVEQILASHPDVHGAGELTLLNDLIGKGHAGTPFPEASVALSAGDWRILGEMYATQLIAMAPEAKRITDKQPYNFLNIGLIHLALPGARVIHVKRNPLDTCFSCYSLMFAGDVNFSYDLGELGRYYKAYNAMMAHWHEVLPDGVMLEVQYEDLVTDLAAQSRRIIDYCGLKWDARCLEFHKTERAVSTASLHQVR
ncbi:MAG: sulfotransferase [Alphaproteobacteria bacterium]|nr:sulfotransferase [Alphaproteobacteria bacterium]